MTDCVDPPNRTLRQNNPEGHIVICLLHDGTFERAFPVKAILGVDALEALFPIRRSVRWIEPKNAVPFLGKMRPRPIRYIQNPAACVGQLLRLSEIKLASLQGFLGALAIFDVIFFGAAANPGEPGYE